MVDVDEETGKIMFASKGQELMALVARTVKCLWIRKEVHRQRQCEGTFMEKYTEESSDGAVSDQASAALHLVVFFIDRNGVAVCAAVLVALPGFDLFA